MGITRGKEIEWEGWWPFAETETVRCDYDRSVDIYFFHFSDGTVFSACDEKWEAMKKAAESEA